MPPAQAIAFAGPCRLAFGAVTDVAVAAKRALDNGEGRPIIIFDTVTGHQIDVDHRRTEEDLRAALAPATEAVERGRGRPKLGVTAREVTLLPRHWDWLATQRGGASAALRRLVDEARRETEAADALREAHEALYRFITVMAGDAEGYEEAVRALFAGDETRFAALIEPWPMDVRAFALTLARPAFGHAPSPLDGLVPEARRPAVDRALAAAFPAAAVQAAERMAWGASGARVIKLTVGGVDCVLRLDGPPDGLRDPARQYACLKIAAEAGVAPPLIYGDAEDRVAVTGFLAALPADPPLSRTASLQAVAGAVKRLHGAPLFPRLMGYFDVLNLVLGQFRASGVIDPEALTEIMPLYARLAAAYPRDEADLVASHNDLNPSNVIFQGARPWFVDWEAACAMDRYVDLAAVSNFFCADAAEEDVVLTAYFGAAPDAGQRARFLMMQQANRLFYGVMLINAAVAERPQTRLTAEDLETPRLAEMRGEMATLFTAEGRLRFGCVFLNEARQVLRSPRFEAALETVEAQG
jgi:aminoglycoside phosphotransferase (APT) family kinase protein